jgi:hypothetical protein
MRRPKLAERRGLFVEGATGQSRQDLSETSDESYRWAIRTDSKDGHSPPQFMVRYVRRRSSGYAIEGGVAALVIVAGMASVAVLILLRPCQGPNVGPSYS